MKGRILVETLLSTGVHLHVIPQHQFKTTQIMVSFAAPQEQVDFAARNLVASLLITSTADHPSQTALARYLNALYGAALDAFVVRMGRTHNLRLNLTVINDRLANEPLLDRAVALLAEVLYRPQLGPAGFDEATFARQRTNLTSNLRSLADDKRFYARQRTEELYFAPGSGMRTPASGTAAQVATLTNRATLAAYRRMLARDRVDVVVVGDVEPTAVAAALARLPWTDRADPVTAGAFFYHQASHPDLWRGEEHQSLQQTRLNQAYRLPVELRDSRYPTAIVMNNLFGGSPASLLFTDLREGASLAYEVGSLLLPFTGHLIVETGIQAQNATRARQMIEEQVTRLRVGDYEDSRLRRVQESLANQYVAGLDSPDARGQRALLTSLIGRPPVADMAAKVRAVTKDAVAALAKELELQAEFRLEGD